MFHQSMMRKTVALIVALMVLCCSAALAETEIAVTGTGEILVSADTAVICLGVSAQNAEVLKAQAQVNEAIAAIRAALTEYGVPAEDLNTDYISIYPVYDYQGVVEKVTAYNANSTLAIRTTNMDSVGEIIDLAFGAGANTLNGINFSARDTGDAEDRALEAAVADARAKAEVLAKAAGLTITGIRVISETGISNYDRGIYNNFAEEKATDASGSTVVQAAKLTVSANVSITFIAE